MTELDLGISGVELSVNVGTGGKLFLPSSLVDGATDGLVCGLRWPLAVSTFTEVKLTAGCAEAALDCGLALGGLRLTTVDFDLDEV